MKIKILKFWLLLNGIIPFGCVISLILFYFHASLILGHLPSYNYPDPKELNIYDLYAPIINFFGFLWIYSFLLWVSALIFYKESIQSNIPSKFILFGLFSFIISIILFFSPILEWFID